MKGKKIHIVWALVVVVALIGGYFWGKARAAGPQRYGFNGAGGAFGSSTRRTGGTAGGGFVSGQIASIDASSITLQLLNGNSEVVFYSTSTQISEPTTVSPSVLKAGTSVMVAGTSNGDGSMTAQSIQVRTGGPGAVGGGAPADMGR